MRLIRFALFACFLLLLIDEVTTTYLSTTTTTTTTKPSTTRRPYTSRTYDECFPPCKLVKVTDAYGQSKSVCKCTTTPTTTTPKITKTPNVAKTSTETTSTSETPSTTITTRVTTGLCPPPRRITCPYEDCDIKSENGYDGCPRYYCDCRDVTTAVTTETRTRTTTSPPCREERWDCDDYGRPCDELVFVGRDRYGCPSYKCICATTTPSTASETPPTTRPTTTPEIVINCFPPCIEVEVTGSDGRLIKTCECPTTSPPVTTTPKCYDLSTSCDMYPCRPIKTDRYDSNGCPVFECFCEDSTTSPPITCPVIAIDCLPGCVPFSTIAPGELCPDYRCECTTTTEDPTQTHTTTSPSTKVTIQCGTPRVTCPFIKGCVIKSSKGYDMCPKYECECTTTTTDETTQTSTSTSPSTSVTKVCTTLPIRCPYNEGCVIKSTKGDDGCPKYDCECTTTTTDETTQTPTTTSPSTSVTTECLIPPIMCPYKEGCVIKSTTRADGCPSPYCECTTTTDEPTQTPTTTSPSTRMTTTTSPEPTTTTHFCTGVPCPLDCRAFTLPPNCPECKCTQTTTTETTETTETTTWPCPEPLCLEGCLYVPRTGDICPWCDCSMLTTAPPEPTTTPTSPRCPAVLCPRLCRYVTLPNGCPGCNCTQTTTPSTTVTTTTPEDYCDDPCERVMGQDGCNSCQCPKTCDDIECESFEECVMQEVFCKRAPCFPVPTCVKRCDSCLAKPAKGKCGGILQHRWTYDSTSNTCKKFQYYGCIPSPNTYKTRQQCVNECMSKAPFCKPCGRKCYTLRRPGGCPKCICPNPCKKFKCPKKKTCKLREMECFREPCRHPRPYCA